MLWITSGTLGLWISSGHYTYTKAKYNGPLGDGEVDLGCGSWHDIRGDPLCHGTQLLQRGKG